MIRKFRATEKLIYDVITRQAGSVRKAILEGVMNSVDAGATRVDIEIQPTTIIIRDNGKGMSKQEILSRFETFGLEYTESERASKTYGEFRMGRGQLFAHGKNVWRTGRYEMVVDIKKNGLTYSLERSQEPYEGCEIVVDLYKEVNPQKLVQEITPWVMFVPMATGTRLSINGEVPKINHSNHRTIEGKHATYLFRNATDDEIAIYNRGVYVCSMCGQGLKGVIVTKKALKVNFARNDIMEDCRVWEKVRKEYNKHRADSLSRMIHLTRANKRGIVDLMQEDKKFAHLFHKHEVFQTANECWVSLNDLKGKKMTFTKIGDRNVEYLPKDVIALSDSHSRYQIMLMFGYLGWEPTFVDYDELKSQIQSKSMEEIDRKLEGWEAKNMAYLRDIFLYDREFLAGKSKTAMAWTNGKDKIWINISLLRQRPNVILPTLVQVVCHELAHDSDTHLSHVHGDTFYQKYYEITERCFPRINRCMCVMSPKKKEKEKSKRIRRKERW